MTEFTDCLSDDIKYTGILVQVRLRGLRVGFPAQGYSVCVFGLTMRAATVERACTVSLEGIPGRSWKITKPHDYVVVDDQMFVRLAAWNLGLLTLVYDQHNRPPANTLTTNNGLTRLIGLRNQQQAAHLADDDGHAQCSLFEPKLKKCRTPQGEQAQKRKSPSCMTYQFIHLRFRTERQK